MTKNKSRIPVLLGAALLMTGSALGQEAASASGGDALGSGGIVNYSVGQVAYTTNSGTNGTVSQGVQQTFEIFITDIKETTLNISLHVFPNPTAENLNLQILDYKNEALQYQVYDMQGKLQNSGQIASGQTSIDMNNLPSATYLLYVNQGNKTIQSFKIIKNNQK